MDYQSALSKAAALCSKQERCISEIEEKLTKWNVEADDICNVIDYLLKEKYIDEQRFANAYVRDKYRFNRWGRIKIRYQLKQKGIVSDVISEALLVIDSDLYKDILNDLLLAKNLLIKKEDFYQRKAALVRYAASRGFEPELIYSKLDAILYVNE